MINFVTRHKEMDIRKQIREKLSERGLSIKEASRQACMPYQNVSSFLKGKRGLSIDGSVQLDTLLGLSPGTIQHALTEEQIQDYIRNRNNDKRPAIRQEIIAKAKEGGAFWSYDSLPENLDDDTVIEEGLRHLEFEDMHLLFQLWDKRHIKRVWKKRLVSEGPRMDILNTLLGILFFDIYDINRYLIRHGHPKN